MKGLEVACFLAALVQLREDVLKRDTLLYHHNGQMINQILDLIHGLAVVAVLRGDDGLAALLAYLFENLVQTLFEQVAGVASLLGIISSVFYRRVQCREYFSVVDPIPLTLIS